MKYFAYNESTGKTYELTKEHFDGRTLYLANMRGSFSPVSFTEILEIQAGKPSNYKVKTDSGKFKMFTSEIIDEFLPKFNKEPKIVVEQTSVKEVKSKDKIKEIPKQEVNVPSEDIYKPTEITEGCMLVDNIPEYKDVVEPEVKSESKPIKTTVRKKRTTTKKVSE